MLATRFHNRGLLLWSAVASISTTLLLLLLLPANTNVQALTTSSSILCALFEGDYDGQVIFVPESVTCGPGTTIHVSHRRDDDGDMDAEFRMVAPVVVVCALQVLVNCFGTGHDQDLISFTTSCTTIRADSGAGGSLTTSGGGTSATASDCRSSVGTIDVWHIVGDELIVQGRLDRRTGGDDNLFGFIAAVRQVK
ncbi:hypothetical protein ACA910_005162 [Epithemia clementina (nom. ined.)]